MSEAREIRARVKELEDQKQKMKKQIKEMEEQEKRLLEQLKSAGRPKSGREIKTRKTITILPSVYDAAAVIAKTKYKAMSELIEELLVEYIEKNKRY